AATLDLVLTLTGKDAVIALEAALRRIGAAFERYDARPSRTPRLNSLAYRAQDGFGTAEDMKEAAVGTARDKPTDAGTVRGFQPAEIAAFLRKNAEALAAAKLPQGTGLSAQAIALETARTLRDLANKIAESKSLPRLEDLER